MSQTQSIFFRLPRELRAEVYNHYVWEEHGCHYDALAGKLRKIDGRPIDVALGYSCRAIYEELEV
jgi:hypothetical protein